MIEKMEPAVEAEDSSDDKRGVEEWKKHTKAIERVISTVLSIDQSRTAGWIADESAVAEATARDHLELLTSLGLLSSATAHGVTTYQPDPAYLRFRSISKLVEQYDEDEIMDIIEDRRKRIDTCREKYGVETPHELRSLAAEPEASVEDIQEYRKVASEWDSLEHQLSVASAALNQYEEYGSEMGGMSV